jgi:hypothetical protein
MLTLSQVCAAHSEKQAFQTFSRPFLTPSCRMLSRLFPAFFPDFLSRPEKCDMVWLCVVLWCLVVCPLPCPAGLCIGWAHASQFALL